MTTMQAPVPFLDAARANDAFRDEFDLVWKSVLDHGAYVGGPEVERFETEFAAYCGVDHCVGVGNGTDALELILAGLGIGRGDEVIVPANTFIATAEAVCAAGAAPRFVDVDPATLLLDADAAAEAINPSTAAVIGVHLYGQMVDVHALSRLARRHDLALIEDAAQAHGARFGGWSAGSAGVASAFSFYPGKNLGALGDAGAVVTGDAALAERVRSFGNHGRSPSDRHRHTLRGRNSRMDSVQAGVLSAKLAHLDAANSARSGLWAAYRDLLPASCAPVATHPLAEPVHHLAVVQVADRGRVTAGLTEAGIGWGIHYPVPCHVQPAFEEFSATVPVTESAAQRIVSLPMSPTLREEQVARVCDVLRGVAW